MLGIVTLDEPPRADRQAPPRRNEGSG